MRRFQFSLAAVLRLREHRESEWELKLGAATSRCVTLQDEIATVACEHQQTVAAGAGAHAADIEFRLWQGAYMAHLEQRRQQLSADLEDAQRARSEVQQQYVAAMRDRKVLSNLKERQEETHRREQLRHEGKVLDDSTNARSARARKIAWEATVDGSL